MNNIMENTLENKAKFFAQYWGQDIIEVDMAEWNGKTRLVDSITLESDSFKKFKLKLTPLSLITDEDVIAVARFAHQIPNTSFKILRRENDIIFIETQICFSETEDEQYQQYTVNIGQISVSSKRPVPHILIIDDLRSKGYALPYMGLLVETLVEYGWVKLKND